MLKKMEVQRARRAGAAGAAVGPPDQPQRGIVIQSQPISTPVSSCSRSWSCSAPGDWGRRLVERQAGLRRAVPWVRLLLLGSAG